MIDIKVGVLLSSAVGVLLAQQAPEPFTPWATGSAAVTLGCVTAWLLTRTIPQMMRDHKDTLDAISDRHERWERIRHEDSTELNSTLRGLSATCARVHHIEERSKP